jgi:hypothetical protein
MPYTEPQHGGKGQSVTYRNEKGLSSFGIRPFQVQRRAWDARNLSATSSRICSASLSADGKTFVVQEPLPGNQSRLTIVQNWYEEFRHRKRD